MAGRRPKPTAVKKLAGNPGKRPLNRREPQPQAASGRAPRGLGREAARFWRKYAPGLAVVGLLSEVDVPALRLAAEHYEIAVRAAEQLHSEELVLKGRDGPKKNPLAQILRDHSAAVLRYLVEFGMTPAARSRVERPDPEQPSLADLLFTQVAQTISTPEDVRVEFEVEDEGE